MLRVLRDYHTKFAHSVSTISFFFFSLFFWLTHAISHRNIVYALFHALFFFLPSCTYFILSISLSLFVIRTFGRSPGFAPPLRSYRARENSKDAISASLKRHGGDNAYFLSPLFIFPLMYTTAPLS